MMRKKLAALAVAGATIALGGCLDRFFGWHYDNTAKGDLKGTLRVTWIGTDAFLYEPDPADPLTFKRADGTTITPAAMFTDGGSIPTALRAIKGYSPWGYAPAFIIHDWLFVMRQCKLPGHEKYDLDTAATIMAEAMKTLMEKPQFGGPNKLLHYSMYEGVRTPTARTYWNEGKCNTPGAAMERVPKTAATRSMTRSAPSPDAPAGPSAAPALPSFTITVK